MQAGLPWKEAWCKTFHMKMSLLTYEWKLIFKEKVSHLVSFQSGYKKVNEKGHNPYG